MNRALDIVAAGFGLALASPLLAVSALAVKFEDGGPILGKPDAAVIGQEYPLPSKGPNTAKQGAEFIGVWHAQNEQVDVPMRKGGWPEALATQVTFQGVKHDRGRDRL